MALFMVSSRMRSDRCCKRLRRDVDPLLALHTSHLRAHEPRHHPQILVAEAEGGVYPEIGDRIELLTRDRVHELARTKYRLRAVATPRVARDPVLRGGFAFAVLRQYIHHPGLVQLGCRHHAA